MVLLLDKLRHLRRGEIFRQLFNARIVRQLRRGHQHVGVRVALRFLQRQRVLRRRQARLQRVVAVDYRELHVIQRARQLRRLDLDDLQVMRVAVDISRRRQVVDGVVLARLQGNQSVGLQQIERAAQVGDVVRHRHLRAVRDIFQGFHLARVEPQRLNMHRRRHVERLAQCLLLIAQIRHMLEVVGVDVAARQQLVGVEVAVEFDHLQIEVRIDLLHVVEDLAVRHRIRRHAQHCRRTGAREERRQRQSRYHLLFHAMSL